MTPLTPTASPAPTLGQVFGQSEEPQALSERVQQAYEERIAVLEGVNRDLSGWLNQARREVRILRGKYNTLFSAKCDQERLTKILHDQQQQWMATQVAEIANLRSQLGITAALAQLRALEIEKLQQQLATLQA